MNSSEAVPKKLDSALAKSATVDQKSYINDEKVFRADFQQVQMAVDKLKEGIDKFAADAVTLKGTLKEKIEKPSA